MTLAKAFVTGSVVRAPEKRFTQNDMPIAAMTVNIDKNNETLLRVISYGQLAENTSANVQIGDEVAVEGKLQVNTFKMPNGKDKKVFEINASSIEKISGTSAKPVQNTQSSENIVSFEENEIAEDLIDEDEIPF